MLLAMLVVLTILLLNEWWWHGRVHGEVSRKFVHITVGTFVAFWPYFLGWHSIELLSLAFIVVVIVSQKLHVFRTIHSVQRPTWGEIFFAVSVGLVAYITHNPVIYAVALLHMALADGVAAIVGVNYGDKLAYRVFGARKSVAGSLAFLTVSLLIFTVYCVSQDRTFPVYLALGSVGAMVLENVAVRGLDNVLIPVGIVLLLQAMH